MKLTKPMRATFKLAVMLLAFTAAPAHAQVPDARPIERFSINVPLSNGYCSLNAANPTDARIIEQNKGFAGNEMLYRVAVECAKLDTWRNDPVKLDNATVHLVIWRSNLEQFPLERRTAWPADECKLAVEQSGQPAGQTLPEFNDRTAAILKSLKPDQNVLIGAVPQSGSGCHLVSVLRIATAAGRPMTLILLRSTATIKGRVLQFWHITASDIGSEIKLLADTAARAVSIVDALPAANP